jgi:hypothetical protein
MGVDDDVLLAGQALRSTGGRHRIALGDTCEHALDCGSVGH